jgi:hypothetical protein
LEPIKSQNKISKKKGMPGTVDTLCYLAGRPNLYSSAKYDRPRLFYTPNYYYLPKWVVDHEKLTLLQAIKIINYRMKNNDSDDLKQ